MAFLISKQCINQSIQSHHIETRLCAKGLKKEARGALILINSVEFSVIDLCVPWREQEDRAVCVVVHQSAGCQRAGATWT